MCLNSEILSLRYTPRASPKKRGMQLIGSIVASPGNKYWQGGGWVAYFVGGSVTNHSESITENISTEIGWKNRRACPELIMRPPGKILLIDFCFFFFNRKFTGGSNETDNPIMSFFLGGSKGGLFKKYYHPRYRLEIKPVLFHLKMIEINKILIMNCSTTTTVPKTTKILSYHCLFR